MKDSGTDSSFLICDINVFVMAYIFNIKIMFESGPYSFGEVFIHETVYDELKRWPNSTAKKRKFGEQILNSMLTMCEKLVQVVSKLADSEKDKLFRRIERTESLLPEHKKSSDTSIEDKMYLVLAVKLKSNLATQEKTLRNLGQIILSPDKIFSFEEMIIDKFKQGKCKKEDIVDGLKNLAQYGENLRKEFNQTKLMEEISKI